MKPIWHLGAWNRNYGDWVIYESIHYHLQQVLGGPLDFIDVDCQKTNFTEEVVDNLNREASMLLVGGGGLVFYRPEDASVSGWQFNISLENLERIQVPLVVYSIGWNEFPFGPQVPWKARKHLQATQGKSAIFSVRDPGTNNELVYMGLSKSRVVMDAAAFCPHEEVDIDLPWDSVLAVNLAGDRMEHRFRNMSDAYEIHEGLVHQIGAAIQQANAPILFIPHMDLDNHFYSMFKGAFPNRITNLMETCPEMYPPSAAQVRRFVGVYSQCKLVVGTRGHSLIIAWGKGVPYMNFGTLEKNLFFSKYADSKLMRDHRRDFDALNKDVVRLLPGREV